MSIVRAVSKLNLYLRVLGKLPNGYHEIETLFLPLTTPSDELEITFRDDGKGEFEIRSDVPLPTGRDNLCGKAADAVCSALGIRPSISINLRKRIPVAAGMGGGSSDAAALLLAVQERYGFLPDRGAEVALSCGADVPFFLDPRPSVGRGLGERLTPLDGIAEPPILILPMPFPVPTPWSYRHLVRTEDDRSIDDLIAALSCATICRRRHGGNFRFSHWRRTVWRSWERWACRSPEADRPSLRCLRRNPPVPERRRN